MKKKNYKYKVLALIKVLIDSKSIKILGPLISFDIEINETNVKNSGPKTKFAPEISSKLSVGGNRKSEL